VVDLPNEANTEQLLDFLMDKVLPLNGLLSRPLLDQSGVGADLQEFGGVDHPVILFW
jgi:hypothetical protein